MTHDELLARLYEYKSSNQGLFEMTDLYQWREALRAVVELHKPEPIPAPCPDGKSGCLVLHYADRHRCTCGYMKYPCPTIQAIEKELG